MKKVVVVSLTFAAALAVGCNKASDREQSEVKSNRDIVTGDVITPQIKYYDLGRLNFELLNAAASTKNVNVDSTDNLYICYGLGMLNKEIQNVFYASRTNASDLGLSSQEDVKLSNLGREILNYCSYVPADHPVAVSDKAALKTKLTEIHSYLIDTDWLVNTNNMAYFSL